MELFRITCVTCSAKLSVRNRAVIGQILACPKCGSMVEVVEPAGSAAQPPVESATESPGPWSDLPASAATASTESSPLADDAAAEVRADSTASTAEAPSTDQTTLTWEAAAGVSRYRLIGVGVSGATAIAVLGGIFMASWSGGEPSMQTASQTSTTVDSTEQPVERFDDTGDSPVAVASEAIDEPTPETFESTPAENPSTPLNSPVVDASPEPAEPSDRAPPDETVVAPESPAPDDGAPRSDRPPLEEAARKPTLRIDPLDVDPEGFHLALLSPQDDRHPSAGGQQGSGDDLPPEPPPAEPISAPPVLEDRAAAHRNVDEVRRVATSAVDEMLSRKFPQIEVEGMPLCEFVDWMTALSGVPISVAPTELQRAGVSATRGVSVDRTDSDVLATLEAALAKLRLQPIVEGAQVVLKRSNDNPLRTVHYPLDDLVSRETSAKQIAGWIQELVSPETWAESESYELRDDRLTITCPECVQYEVLLLLERLRLARGVPARTSYPRRLLTAESSYAAMYERLSAPAIFTFSQSTPLQEVVRHWQQELGTPVLVDWPALAELDLWPRSEIWCRADRDAWHEALDEVLTPLGLTWTTSDGRTLVITTEAAARKTQQLEFYLRPDAAESMADRVGQFAETAAIFDPVSRVLIVRSTPEVHRDLAQ